MFGVLIVSALVLAAVPAKPVRAAAKLANAPAAVASSRHTDSPYMGAITANAETGEILFRDNAEREAYPASVTKLMTLCLVLEDVRAGRYAFDDSVTATPDVYRCEPSWIGIKPGEKMSVRGLCLALMVESANDAAIALGIHSAGSFDAFVARMNERAAALGMAHTRYYNPNGLPPNATRKYPWKSFNVTTASDQLKLALRMLKMPETLEFTSVKTCDLIKTEGGYRIAVTRRVGATPVTSVLAKGETLVKQMRNHNHIMVKDKQKIFNPDGSEAVDGLKTGYINAGGSSIVITGRRGKKRVVAVVLGSSRSAERDENARRLLVDALGAVSW